MSSDIRTGFSGQLELMGERFKQERQSRKAQFCAFFTAHPRAPDTTLFSAHDNSSAFASVAVRYASAVMLAFFSGQRRNVGFQLNFRAQKSTKSGLPTLLG